MRTKIVYLVMMVCMVASVAQAIDMHWRPPADPNRVPALWSVAANWSSTTVPAVDDVVWVSSASTAPCLMLGNWSIRQLKLGEGGDGSNNGHLIVKGILDTRLAGEWQGIGAWGGNVGVLEVDGGKFNTYGGGHMWIGNQGNGTVIVKNGGEVNVGIGGGAQMGHGWDGGSGWGRTYIQDGLVTVNNWTTGSVHPATASFIDIERGTLSIQGYRFGGTDGVDVMATQGRITGFRNAKFDKKLNIDNPGNNRENDVINNVLVRWNGARTLVTAVHPVQPMPYYNDVVQYGNRLLEWNNWDPNRVGDSVVVDVWFGTEPNKLGTKYTKVLAGANVTGLSRSSFLVNAPTVGKYYWQVDTTNGPGAFREGDVFSFNTTDNLPPVVDAGPGFITWVGRPITMNATVTDEATPILAWTAAPNTDAVFANAAIEDATVTFSAVGTYTLTLTANDGFNAPVSDTATVNVYADACAAARDGQNIRPVADIVVDCVININDFAAVASEWLRDYALTGPVNN